MAKKKITRKVIPLSKKSHPLESRPLEEKVASQEIAEERVSEKTVSKTEETGPFREVGLKAGETNKSKRACFFCQSKTSPTYTDIATLRRYLTDRAKIVARAKSGLCGKHQRAASKQIKYARHLALLPFTPKV